MLSVGDWVNRNNAWDKTLGLITDQDDFLFLVQWLTDDRKAIQKISWVNQNYLKKAPLEVDKKDRDLLFFDLALLTNDQKWIKRLYPKIFG